MSNYLIHGLVKKRVKLMGEIHTLKQSLQTIQEQIKTLDKTIHLFDPNYELEHIRIKRSNKRVFQRGEFANFVFDLLRESKEYVSTESIIKSFLQTKADGLSNNLRSEKTLRTHILARLHRYALKGMLEKRLIEGGREYEWRILTSSERE